ncbi:hypothetical protein D3C87_1797220 [compost metagenome]
MKLMTKSPPAPAPWSAREATSSGMVREAPHRADPARKSAIATKMKRRWPKRSDSLPYRGVTTVEASMKAVATQG